MLWYLSLLVIIVAGVSLVVYSRNESMHRAAASTVSSAPTTSDNWYTALGFDVCGTIQPDLATSTNLATAGIRTFGDGIVNTSPGAVKDSSKFTGDHATLGTFVSTYGHHLLISSSALELPGKTPRRYVKGERCTTGPDAGKKAAVEVELWSSPTAAGTLFVGDPSTIRLTNGQMIMVAFVPPGSSIPSPSSKSALLQDLGKR